MLVYVYIFNYWTILTSARDSVESVNATLKIPNWMKLSYK